MSAEQIEALETKIFELNSELRTLRKTHLGPEVPDYSFETLAGQVQLSDLFAGSDTLLAIHNMGQACRYCTLWADGINGLLPHLESAMAVVLLSKDDPATQRRMASARQWRFRMASHGGGDYMKEQVARPEFDNMPSVACYQKRDGKIFLKNRALFGPGDIYCPQWHFLALAGINTDEWTPQYNYWKRPRAMEDGGENLID